MIDTEKFPLVSCIMPTANRRAFVPRAIAYFLRQDYPHKELVIVDDGSDAVGDLVPAEPQVRYVCLTGQRTLGAKRNTCVEASRGDLIMHWDDDDWMAPHRIRTQVEALLHAGAEICSLRRMVWFDLESGKPWLYTYPDHERPWLAGNVMVYTRAFWRRAPFPNIQVGSDTRFVWSQPLDRAVALPDYTFYVGMIHPNNTSRKVLHSAYWSPWQGDLAAIMGADLDFYQALSGGHQPAPAPARPPAPKKAVSAVAVAAPAPPPLPAIESRGVPSLLGMQPHVRLHSALTEQSPLRTIERQGGMRIGYILVNFPPLSETFIRREIFALCASGHRVTVYTHYVDRNPLVPAPQHPGLVVRQVPFQRNYSALAQAVAADGIEHLRGSLMLAAHQATHAVARALQVPFSLTVYSGHDVFTARDPQLYRAISADPLCVALVVEDAFMQQWIVGRLGADPAKIALIANAFDLELYRRRTPRPAREQMVILAIARFVEKKGLLYLIQAFNRLRAGRSNLELWLVGLGPEEGRLRAAAAGNPQVKFLGAVTEERTRQLYASADIFCLPCVQAGSGDADGVPTTVLEAMAFELPVVSSNLLSTPYYVRDRQEGLLAAPGDVAGIAAALQRLCDDASLRAALGTAGRARVVELCDLAKNSAALQQIILEGRQRQWQEKMAALQAHRAASTPEREAYYTACRARAAAYFQPQGRLLDIGCGKGKMRLHMPPGVTYEGCDPLPDAEAQASFPFHVAGGEQLPFADGAYDAALLYAVLPHVFSVDAVLVEAARVVKPGGYLYLHECVNDPNPIHLNHLTDAELQRRVGEHFQIMDTQPAGPHLLMIKAQKPATEAQRTQRIESIQRKAVTSSPSRPVTLSSAPLVSVAITTYNRATYLRTAIDSALNQSYRPVEVVVVDDGSTDDSRRILEGYGAGIRVAYNEQNRGIAFSKNRALTMTLPEARYVAILDSDDYYHPEFVARCVAHLERQAGAGLVYTDDILVDGAGRELRRQPAIDPWNLETWLRTCNLRGDTWVVRRDLVMRTALHDESMAYDVDYDLFYQLLELTTFAHVPAYLVYIRQHGERSTRNVLGLAKCHAANLVKYGYSPEYAYLRARHHPEWHPAIEEGIALGSRLREKRGEIEVAGINTMLDP